MRVSVIIPAYNSEKYLRESVESAVANTWPNKEVIIFNDGSEDRTHEIASQLEREYPGLVRALSHPDGRNHGVAPTRNCAAENSTGDLLAFLDADDRMLPDHVARSVKAFSERPETGLTYGRARYLLELDDKSVWTKGREGGWGPARGIVPDAFERLLSGNFIQMSTILCKKDSFFSVGGFDEGMQFMQEDYVLWTKLAYHYPVFYLDELCAEYRIHHSSYSATLEWEKVASAKQFEYLDRISKWVPHKDAEGQRMVRRARQELGSRVMYRLYCALRRKDFAQARREADTLRRIPGKVGLMAAPFNWYRNRSSARRKTNLEERLIGR